MPLIGIYSLSVDQADKPLEEQTVQRLAAYDPETGEWTDTSRGDILSVIYPEYLEEKREQGVEAVLEYLREEFGGTMRLVVFEEEMPADVENLEPLNPSEIEIGENAPEWRYDLDSESGSADSDGSRASGSTPDPE